MELVTCRACGIVFGVPEAFIAQRRADHKEFHCPNGHSLAFKGETEEDKLRRQVKALAEARDRESLRAGKNWEAKRAADRRIAALRGQVTKLKRREVTT